MKILIKNGIVIADENTIIENGCVIVENGKIVSVNQLCEDADKIIDAKGNYIVPALMDIHTHGAFGYDFNECSVEEIDKIAEYYRSEGVTTFLGTLVCETHEDLKKLFAKLENCSTHAMAGVYIEGPFLSMAKKAVMKEECICEVDLDKFKEYKTICPKLISMTVAPELEHALDLITLAKEMGVVINVGHTNGSAQDILAAQKAGAKSMTHLYNAMSQHEHRNPGVVTGAILSDLYCELICDGFHVHEDIVKATYKMIGKDRLILISDANPCKGLKDGEYKFSGKNVVIKNGEATVKETGRIAGGTLKMNQACYNMKKWCNASIVDCLQMCVMNPARLYNLNKGFIKAGFDGDILVMDEDFTPIHLVSEDIVWY